MYDDLLFEFKLLEDKFRYNKHNRNLLKPLHNKLLHDYPRGEIIEELFYILANIRLAEIDE